MGPGASSFGWCGIRVIEPVVRAGHRLAPAPSLAEIRERTARSLAALPPELNTLGETQIAKLSQALSAHHPTGTWCGQELGSRPI